MQSYHDDLILQFDDAVTGNAASGALVTVFNAGLATKPALFDVNGSPIPNPLTTDINGNFSFKVADGEYDIVGRAGTPDETRRDRVTFTSIQKIIEEPAITLADGQTSVTFTLVDATTAFVYLSKVSGDRGRLFEGADYSIINPTSISLNNSEPAGTKLFANSTEITTTFIDEAPVNVKDFGANGDGITDDTAAIESAISSSGAAKIYFPAGVYVVSSQISATDKFLHFAGDGPRVSEIKYTGTNGLFRFVRTGEETAFYMVSDIMLNATSVLAGDAIQIEQDQTTGVIGGVDSLHIRNVICESTDPGYWTIGLHTINIGGVYVSDTTFRNDNDSVAQNDLATRGVFIENNKAGINVIRALHMTNFYIQRFQRAVLCDAVNTIESVYIDRGEFVGHAVGFYVSGAGSVGAINLSAIHMDSIQFSVFIESTANLMRIVGCDLRGASNGAAASNYIAVRLNEGETVAIVGTHFSAHNISSPSLQSTGVRINSSIRTAISGCTFRNLDEGIILPTVNTEYSIGANDFQQVVLSITNGYANRAGLLEHLGQTTTVATFGGDLDNLVDNIVQGMLFTKLNNSATNGPGVNLTGAVITTMVFDAGAAYQTLYENGATDIHYRKKTAGTWSAWVIK